MSCRLLIAVFVLGLALPAIGGTADEEWAAILALDGGPKTRPRSGAEAQALVLEHLGKQEQALRAFLQARPGDPHVFEARLRLVRLLALRAEMRGSENSAAEAERLLTQLKKSATPAQRAEIEFARLSVAMRRIAKDGAGDRDQLLARARRFQALYPADRRLGALFAEVATLFDLRPQIKKTLLLDAQAHAGDPELRQRLADDLRRLDLLGQPIELRGPGFPQAEVALQRYRGEPVLLIFFAVWSAPSLHALDVLRDTVARLPNSRVQVVGVSLDTKKEPLAALLKEKRISWPVLCDGEGWESARIRSLGINALPTVWLLDGKGRLRSLDALQGTADQVRQLIAEYARGSERRLLR
ncbi:MAG: TlpA family protein disulfide reductase [Verrucomicrobiota bacterium]|nr:TlpA family protein disulfide reductase [Verrucomicrobiota bacterium]